MQYQLAAAFLLQKIEQGLPGYLTYHNPTHTKDVVAATTLLAASENIHGEELILLQTAALFHDAGFLEQSKGHEEVSCRLAEEYLPGFDYTPEQIRTICRLIRATRWPHAPTDLLEEILCDADLFYLGTDQYEEFAERLFPEMKRAGVVKTKTDWLLRQVEFMTAHRYFTRKAREEREAQKQLNLQRLEQKLTTVFASRKRLKPMEIAQDLIFMLVGVLFAGYALKGFLVPNHFFDGGITGISLLVHEVYHLNLALVIVLLNLPLIITSYFTVGSRFALRTLLGVILLGVCLLLLPDVALTTDKLLISIFGGVFLGIGIGLVMRAGAALDGIEVLALYTLKKTSFTISEIILGLNILIFVIAAFQFGIESALYSMLTYFAATRCIDYVVEGIQAFTGVTIISGKSEVIKYQLVNNLGRGITVYKGERGFLPGQFEVSSECDIIFTVISRLELRKLKNLVYQADPKAFVFASTIKEASGGVIQRRHQH